MPTSENPRPRRVSVLLARVRMPLMWVGTLALVAGGLVGMSWWLCLPLFAAALLVYLRVGRADCAPLTLAPPVRGRWMALASPADGVPSQGSHAYGQTYALLLVAEPEGDGPGASRPDIGWRPLTRAPEEFPAFGAPVLAPAAGTVVRVRDGCGDHRSRTSWPMLFTLVAETAARELLGPSGLLGNHIVIALDGGGHILLAHLRRGSAAVAPGERVRAGQPIARCGASGAITEPHLKVQLMDHRSPLLAAGLPFRWEEGAVDGRLRSGLPRAWEPFRA